MKFTKRITTILAILTLLGVVSAPPAARAQQYSVTAAAGFTNNPAAFNGGTNTVLAQATNGTYVIPLTKFGDVGIDIAFRAHTASSTSNLVVALAEANDGTGTNGMTGARKYLLAIPANSTTLVRYVTNFTVNSVGYLYLTAENTNASGVFTNVAVSYVTKPKRFGN